MDDTALEKKIYKVIFKSLYIYKQLLEGWKVEKMDIDAFKFEKQIDEELETKLKSFTTDNNLRIHIK